MKEFQDTDPKEQGSMALNIIHFSRLLRSSGMQVGPASAIDAVDALCKVTPHPEKIFIGFYIVFLLSVETRMRYSKMHLIFFGVAQKCLSN